MAENNNATCSICGKKYHVCLSCRDSINLNPWKIHTDTMTHFKIYQVLHGVTTGVYSKDEAKSKLNNIDLGDLNEFKPHIKETIQDILKEDETIVEIAEPIIAMAETEDLVAKIDKTIEKPIISRKRNYKAEVE